MTHSPELNLVYIIFLNVFHTAGGGGGAVMPCYALSVLSRKKCFARFFKHNVSILSHISGGLSLF